ESHVLESQRRIDSRADRREPQCTQGRRDRVSDSPGRHHDHSVQGHQDQVAQVKGARTLMEKFRCDRLRWPASQDWVFAAHLASIRGGVEQALIDQEITTVYSRTVR